MLKIVAKDGMYGRKFGSLTLALEQPVVHAAHSLVGRIEADDIEAMCEVVAQGLVSMPEDSGARLEVDQNTHPHA